MIKVKVVENKGLKRAEQILEEFLNEIGQERIVTITQGMFYNATMKMPMVSYTVVYRD